MFTAEEIQARLRKQPFQPLRIIASEGLRYDIYHPDLVVVGRRYLVIGSPDLDSPTIFDRITYVSLVHVVALEDLASPVSTLSNGTPG
jgi:hypothetical protein